MCTRALYCVVYDPFTPGVSSIWMYISLRWSFMWKHCVYLKRISDPPTAINVCEYYLMAMFNNYLLKSLSSTLTMYGRRAGGRWTGRPGGSGTSGYRSSPRGRQSPVAAPWTCPSQTVGSGPGPPGQRTAAPARTTESVNINGEQSCYS